MPRSFTDPISTVLNYSNTLKIEFNVSKQTQNFNFLLLYPKHINFKIHENTKNAIRSSEHSSQFCKILNLQCMLNNSPKNKFYVF